MWFRRDLRLKENPALAAACETGRKIICLYIHDEVTDGLREDGGASKWWLDKSLKSLGDAISQKGGKLILRSGQSDQVLNDVIEQTGATGVYWTRRYGAAERQCDAGIKESLTAQGIDVQSRNGSLLTEPWTFQTGSGGHYKVFTPYWKSVWAQYQCPSPLPDVQTLATPDIPSDDLADWGLHPSSPDWSTGFSDMWVPGENGAMARLADFLEGPVSDYQAHRNRPDLSSGTSGLSPHLRSGEISPVQVWRAVQQRIESGGAAETDAMVFLSEIVWREFAYVLLYYHPDLADENYNGSFQHMPWRSSSADLERWQRGQTGYPVVDAGMRQLWQTGWMHNRVRMIVASFLTKHLLLPWQLGEDWFWDTLVDADPASNAASWQWTAGSGADAAPYFRVFNPITQGEKFDETGNYVLRWCPELKDLPRKYLYAPWTAPEAVLDQAGITLGETYPRPIIEHSEGRTRALNAYDTLKQRRDAV